MNSIRYRVYKINSLIAGVLIGWGGVFSTQAQTSVKQESLFDFWLGTWEVSWENRNGDKGSGTNHIRRILDGKVIQENFEITQGKQVGFKGRSLSVFNTQTKKWHQTWVDNQGGYFNFVGETDDEKRIFITKPKKKQNGNTQVQRMVFYEIKKDSFTWDWESSSDEEITWNLNWRIFYKRQK